MRAKQKNGFEIVYLTANLRKSITLAAPKTTQKTVTINKAEILSKNRPNERTF